MTKVFKHKTLGWIAEVSNATFYKVSNWTLFISMTPKELIEDSYDWEEFVERNYVDEVFEIMGDEYWWDISKEGIKNFKKEIEKHAPKQKVFPERDLREFSEKYFLDLPYNRVVEWMIRFLKAHWLLLSDEQND